MTRDLWRKILTSRPRRPHVAMEFKNIDGHIVPSQPWPQVFYVSNFLLPHDAIDVRPLTLTGIVKGIGKNFITMSYWRVMFTLYLLGFLPTGELAQFSWRTFTLRFWRHWQPRRLLKRRYPH